mgnify:FL=1
MNNSKIAYENLEEDEKLDHSEFLQRQKGEITQIVEAINRVEASEDWQKLKDVLLDGIVGNLERQLLNEAVKGEIDSSEMYRLQGQLFWARKYADLKKLSDMYRQQVENIKNQIKHEKNPRDGAL